MVTTVLFAAGLILVLAVIGRTVHYPGLPFDVEPAFARYVVTGVVILWHIGQANAGARSRASRGRTKRRSARNGMA
ncbi:hypothetical protein FB384_004060 [Prauserella sediminis]|uniref:Uncharacterized protein n=1 Tax=Prauserella sediminis TaxID=577680 RepID=A0A839XSX2_9PSEU|nr:hypothetical protein [Prauserella sediminis]MBB3665109.1 hypothetical protein [Prauserella sediminis]